MTERIITVVCPKCGSADVTCDANARWNVKAQAWDDLSSSQDHKTCEDCGYDNDDFKEVEIDAAPETSDVGLFIASALGLGGPTPTPAVPIYAKQRHGEELDGEQIGVTAVNFVDASDPDNLVLTLEDGKQFIIRIIAG